MDIAARLAEIGKPAWIALTVLGFIFYWPMGLAAMAFVIWSGRMGCWKHQYAGYWHSNGNTGYWDSNNKTGFWHSKGGTRMGDWGCHWFGHRGPGSSGNRAFVDFRAETLRRLEEEQ